MIQFPPLSDYSTKEKIESYKTFYQEYILGRQIAKKDIKELGLLIENASNFLLKNPQRLYDANESTNWNAINIKIKKISPKLYSEVYSKIVSSNSPALNYVDNNDGFWKIVGKVMVNSDITKLNNAETRIPFLQALHSCLEVSGLHKLIEDREPSHHKTYNVRVSPIGILNEYAFFLNQNALKEIIFAYKHDKSIPFKGKKIRYDERREIEITSTLLKEDEVPLFLEKEGVFLMKKKKWRNYHCEDFFNKCEKEPNLLYDYPNFHPSKPIQKEETVLDNMRLPNLSEFLKSTNVKYNRQVVNRLDNTKKKVPIGAYRTLIIGVSEYKLLRNLNYPVSDANKFRGLLESEYGFLDTLFLENPTRSEIIDAFDILEEELKTGDNLLIFYAGHGYRDANKGYWMPKDAHSKRRSNWIENSTILTYFERLDKCQHILLIDDSCFSGSWLETRKPNINTLNKTHSVLYQAKSRIVLTSGAKNEEVLDKSEFFAQIFKELKDNDSDSFDIVSRFGLIQNKVIAINPNQKPQCGKLPSKSDEGGSLILYKKKNH